MTEQQFLGVGWNYPTKLTDDGQIDLARYEESIRQAIWIILGTAPGERLMRPGFGCGIHDLVFAPNSPGTASQVAGEVRRALLDWEPRIDLLSVQVEPQAAEPATLLIRIEYRVRMTNNRFNMVFPFYLE